MVCPCFAFYSNSSNPFSVSHTCKNLWVAIIFANGPGPEQWAARARPWLTRVKSFMRRKPLLFAVILWGRRRLPPPPPSAGSSECTADVENRESTFCRVRFKHRRRFDALAVRRRTAANLALHLEPCRAHRRVINITEKKSTFHGKPNRC